MVYLSQFEAYQEEEFVGEIVRLIQEKLHNETIPVVDLYNPESNFYVDLSNAFGGKLNDFCDALIDEVHESSFQQGHESGYEDGHEEGTSEGYDSGWDAGRERADDHYSDEIEALEETISNLEEEISDLENQINNQEVPDIDDIDIDSIREAIRIDLMAELADYSE